MLREYISRKIRENEELIIDLESDIKNGRNRKKELEKLIEILEDENNDGSEIFSPRNHREQNLDKLKHYREELKKISEEIEDRLNKLNETKKKRTEYKSMLAETERIHQEEEKYENIENQIKSSQSEKEQPKTEQQAHSQAEERPGDDKEVGGHIGQQTQGQEEQQVEEWPGDDKAASGHTEQQTQDQTEQEGDEQLNVEIEQQTDKNLIQPEEQAEELEYEEEETVPNAMDTKIIIQKSIEEIVKRIEAEKDKKPEQQEQKREEKPPQKYETKQTNENNIFPGVQGGSGTDNRGDLKNIEIKSAELIVLESERKKEKEFLEKVKKGLDLCFVYSGNRSKCRNELIKIKKMIENYIASIE